MNIPNIGKYASVCDLPYTTQKLNYHRGYGNIVIHDVKGDNSVTTNITKFNRIDPLKLPFGEDYPKAVEGSNYIMANSESTIAWADTSFYKTK
jgi:hypothetical protein